MTKAPALTTEQKMAGAIIKAGEQAMMSRVENIIQEAALDLAAQLRSVPLDPPLPDYQYYLAVAHRELLVRLCGADPVTHQGGDAKLANAIMDSDRNFVSRNWVDQDKSK